MNENVITLSGVSKSFRLKKLRGSINHFIREVTGRKFCRRIEALKNINIAISRGENLAVIGKNGSGKSTLLRVIAGIYKPDHGTVSVSGAIHYLSGINHPVNRQLTGIENVKLIGLVYDIPESMVLNCVEEIREFSGLKDRLEDQVITYSDGMVGRLSFSIFAKMVWHKTSEILVFDEVFSGGADEEFRKKALLEIDNIMKSGATVVTATHNLDRIDQTCSRTILLERGEIKFFGDTSKAIEIYKKM